MPPSSLEVAIHGVYATHAVHLAAKHGVFTHLAKHGMCSSSEIAEALGVDGDTLERIMLVLAAYRVVSVDANNRYLVPEESVPYLDPASPRYVGGFVSHLVNSTAGRLAQLDDYLKRGKADVDASQSSPFDVIYKDSAAEFLTAMWQLSFDVSRDLVVLAELSDCRHLVDVGGASGPFTVAALLAMPRLRATVFDLPPVQQYLEKNRADYSLQSRLDFVQGDFFRDALPEGDCIAFGYILSDWTDQASLALLRKGYTACAKGGRVLVMERLFDDDKRGPLPTAVMNLSMHVEAQGRHRTAAEYVSLLESAGFRDCNVRRSTRDKHLVIGYKVEPRPG